MDAFENSDYEYIPEVPEEAPPQEPQEHSYHAAGTGRKESPYANSPYEAYHAPREEYRYHPQTEPPVKTKKAKKPLVYTMRVKRMLVTLGILFVLVAAASFFCSR